MIEVLKTKLADRKISDQDHRHGKIIRGNYHNGLEKKEYQVEADPHFQIMSEDKERDVYGILQL